MISIFLRGMHMQACGKSCLILLIYPFRIPSNKQQRTHRAPQPQIYLFHNSWPISVCVRVLAKAPTYRAVHVIDHWLQHHADMPSLKTPKVLLLLQVFCHTRLMSSSPTNYLTASSHITFNPSLE